MTMPILTHSKFVLMMIFALVLSFVTYTNAQSTEGLWPTIKSQPNSIVLIRNSHLDRSSGNPVHWDENGNCNGEVLLSKQGKEQALRIGKAFRDQGIKPIVISSPMCRCVQTAELAFGSDFITDPLLREIASADSVRYDAFLEKTTELLISNRGKVPIVFVSHRPNIEALTFELISVTELLQGVIDDSGEIEVIDRYEL